MEELQITTLARTYMYSICKKSIQIFIISVLPSIAFANDIVGGVNCESVNANPTHSQAFADAMGEVASIDPAVHGEITAALNSGSVTAVDISNEIGDDFKYEQADKDTLGVELDHTTPAGVAATIIHEWTHVKGLQAGNGYGANVACAEAPAYFAEVEALAQSSCENDEANRPSCLQWQNAVSQLATFSAKCVASGGSSPGFPDAAADSDSPPCGCN